MAESLKFLIVNTKEQGMFIKHTHDNYSASYSEIPQLFFDDKKLVSTYKTGWFKISNIPTIIQKKGADTRVNVRYELKAGYPVSELTPQTISGSDFDSDDEIAGLYRYEFDTVEGELENVEFKIEVLDEVDNFYVEKPKFPSTAMLIDELTSHPDLLMDKPRKISSQALYKLIREHVKANIDRKYATISSDYDFCFTVQKVIAHSPVSHTVDVGKRKPKYETRYTKQRTVIVYETAPKTYNSYPVIQPMTGKNQIDLEEKIEVFLSELMEKINQPLIECECCKGMGVILE